MDEELKRAVAREQSRIMDAHGRPVLDSKSVAEQVQELSGRPPSAFDILFAAALHGVVVTTPYDDDRWSTDIVVDRAFDIAERAARRIAPR